MKHAHSTWRRWPCRALLALAAGAATAVVVALGSAAMRPTDGWPNVIGDNAYDEKYLLPPYRLETPGGSVGVHVIGGKTHTLYTLHPFWTRSSDVPIEELLQYYPRPAEVPAELRALFGNPKNYSLPAWVSQPLPGTDQRSVETSAWGWPERCLYGTRRVWWVPFGSPTATEIFEHDGFLVLGGSTDRVRNVPYHVLPAGLFLNTLVFAATWTLLSAGLVAVWRLRRRKRGRCHTCGYDLRGLALGAPCPECGADTS